MPFAETSRRVNSGVRLLNIMSNLLIAIRSFGAAISVNVPARAHFIVLLGCCTLLTAQSPATFALQSRSSLCFEIKTVNPSTSKRKTIYSLGETVSVVFTLTNQGRTARKIKDLQDTEIPIKITLRRNRSDKIDIHEGIRGGTGGAYSTPEGDTIWTSRDPRYRVIYPGQTLKVEIEDLGRFFGNQLDDGKYTLSAKYNDRLQAQCSFKIVINEGKTIPILERMSKDKTDSSERWADSYLKLIRQPAISGRIATTRHKGLKGVWISVTGSEKTNIETEFNGLYDLTRLISGGTYTLTPSLEGYTFSPRSRTIRNLTSKLTSVNFTAKRILTSYHAVSETGNLMVKASSTFDKDD
jgi:hypothetical protein